MGTETAANASLDTEGSLPVAIVGAPPAYRHGLLGELEANGCRAVDPDDALSWAREQGRCAVLVVVDGTPTEVQLLERYTALHGVHVVALLRHPTRSAVISALRAGADSVAAWDSVTEHLVTTITAAARDFIHLPVGIARQLFDLEQLPRERLDEVSEEQLEWLAELAQGCTVTQLAKQAGYSERAMHRLLRSLYQRLGVKNRSDAIVLVSRCGLFDRTSR